ncbi:MAG: glycosyltransferase family 4 protein, partial [Candidatus Omnitrophica bacterium]|nr:glycosyltransferase family 4 protein [Candidatus Omnitrophota bacterium]
LGVADRVIFGGWMEQTRVKACLASADVFVSASKWEGMPNACLEAMAAGLPLVLSRIAGHEELVEEGKNGFLFEQDNGSALADLIRGLAESPAIRLRMGRESLRIASERFRWEDSAARCLEIFERCRNLS